MNVCKQHNQAIRFCFENHLSLFGFYVFYFQAYNPNIYRDRLIRICLTVRIIIKYISIKIILKNTILKTLKFDQQ